MHKEKEVVSSRESVAFGVILKCVVRHRWQSRFPIDLTTSLCALVPITHLGYKHEQSEIYYKFCNYFVFDFKMSLSTSL